MVKIEQWDLTGLVELISEAFQTFNKVFYTDWCACEIEPDFLVHEYLSEMKLDFHWLARKYNLSNKEIQIAYYFREEKGKRRLNCGPNPVTILARRWLFENLGIKPYEFKLWKPNADFMSVHIQPYALESQLIESVVQANKSARARIYFTGFVGNPVVVFETRMNLFPTVYTTNRQEVKIDFYSACHQRDVKFTFLSSDLMVGVVTASTNNPWAGIHLWKKVDDVYRLVAEKQIVEIDSDALISLAKDCRTSKILKLAG